MNIVKRMVSVFRNRICLPLYAGTIKAAGDKKRIREKYQIKKGVKNVVIFGTPNHGNLGDYAIYLAERELFARYLPKCNIFGVNMTDFQHEVKALHGLLKKEDLLVLTGGGNLGNQYMDDERIRREVISRFPNNRIVLFPQTMYFTKDEQGKEEERKTAAIYGRHKDLWLTARDEKSRGEMERLFSRKIRLLPDVVLTWKGRKWEEKKGALLVLRNDVEGVLCTEQKKMLRELLLPIYGTAEETDTVVKTGADLSLLEKRLREKMEQIGRASLVVTDRLHGMIFAALMQTPCVVLHNYNHKVEETYKWIQDLDYVDYVADPGHVEEALGRLQKKECNYSADRVEKEYDAFMRELISENPARF